MSTRVPFRVVLTNKGVTRKFFTFFEGKDGSLYFHPNRESNKPWKVPLLMDNPLGMKINWGNQKAQEFELHKISFHPSGFIHLSNKNGERYRNGTRGPTFEEMDSIYLLCIIAPCKLEKMPVFKKDRKCMLVNLVLRDNITPFVMTLALAKEHIYSSGQDPTQITPRFILPLQSGYKLTFLLRSVLPTDKYLQVNWPPFPFFMLRTAK